MSTWHDLPRWAIEQLRDEGFGQNYFGFLRGKRVVALGFNTAVTVQ